MNFTEVSELNEILSHCRSFHPQVPNISHPDHNSSHYSPFEQNFISVDELISSSFRDYSPKQGFSRFLTPNHLKEDENIEKLISDINQTAIPMILLRNDRKNSHTPIILISQSPTMNEFGKKPQKKFKVKSTSFYNEENSSMEDENPEKETSIDLMQEKNEKSEEDENENKDELEEEFRKKEEIFEKKKQPLKEEDFTKRKENLEKEYVLEKIEEISGKKGENFTKREKKLQKDEDLENKEEEMLKQKEEFLEKKEEILGKKAILEKNDENERKKIKKKVIKLQRIIVTSKDLPEIKSLLRQNTMNVLIDINKKTFRKLQENDFLSYYHEKTQGKSFLSESLLNNVIIFCFYLIYSKSF